MNHTLSCKGGVQMDTKTFIELMNTLDILEMIVKNSPFVSIKCKIITTRNNLIKEYQLTNQD